MMQFKKQFYLQHKIKLLILFLCISSIANCQINCQKLSKQQLPVLIYTCFTGEKTILCVANFENKVLHKERIPISSENSINVTQLDRSIFLITQQGCDIDKTYVIDLNKGIAKVLFENKQISCLRTEPQSKTAMLADFDENDISLIELNLENFEIKMKYNLSEEELGKKYYGLRPRMKLSSDFQHLAYVSSKNSKIWKRDDEYILKVLHLPSMKTEILDSNVGVQLSWISSFSHAMPPFEWISNDEIFYQDIPLNKPNSGFKNIHIFKIVNIKTKKISEVFQKEIQLALDGGSLQLNPFNEKLIYRDKEIIDITHKTIISKYLPFSTGKDYITNCISPSGKNFAYTVRSKNQYKLYVKMEGVKGPIEVAKEFTIYPIAWIEEPNQSQVIHGIVKLPELMEGNIPFKVAVKTSNHFTILTTVERDSFISPKLSPDTYQVILFETDKTPGMRIENVVVANNTPINNIVFTQQNSSISLILKNGKGEAVSGAYVTICKSSSTGTNKNLVTFKTGNSDEKGNFTAKSLADGTYMVSAKVGNREIREPLDLKNNQDVKLNLLLTE